MGRLLTKSLLAAFYLSSTVTASSHIFARQQPNCPANFSKCPQASFPDNFCCPSSATCIPLAAGTTLLCCPAGSDCTTIAAITCNVEQQDPLKNPTGLLKTTALTSTLQTCGSRCCPFGFSCNKENNCQLDKNQDIAPVGPSPSNTASSSTTPSTPTSTSSPTNSISPITTTTPLPSPTALPVTNQTCPRFPILSIIIFFFTGLIAGILITLFILFILLKCTSRTPKSSNLRRASTQSFGNKVSFQGSSSTGPPTSSTGSKFISSPKLNPDSATRSDFLRKQEWDGTPSRKQGGGGTIKNLMKRMSRGKPLKSEGVSGEPIPALPSHTTPPPPRQTPVRIPSPLQIRKISNSNSNTEKKPAHPVTPPNQRAASSQDGFGQIVVFTDGQTADELRHQTGGSNYKETGGSGLGIGNGNTMNGGGLLPPPTFLGERDRGSAVTTFTQFIPSKEEGGSVGGNGKKGHRRTSSAIAGLVPHQPFNYNSPAGYSSPAYSDTGSRLQKL